MNEITRKALSGELVRRKDTLVYYEKTLKSAKNQVRGNEEECTVIKEGIRQIEEDLERGQ